MGLPDANPPMPDFREDYVLTEVDATWLSKAVKPKQFIHIDQSECILCEGCVDICPWKCWISGTRCHTLVWFEMSPFLSVR